MARIRGDNLKPESRLAAALERAGLGCFRNVSDMPGKPDFVFEREGDGLAVFVHGCFWHKCARHWRAPKSRQRFWRKKFAANVKRDARVRRELRAMFHGAMVVWEHDLGADAAADRVAERIKRRLASLTGGGWRKINEQQ